MTAVLQNILCVDDEPDVLSVAKMCLKKVGSFSVTAVGSGKMAIESVAQAKPDAILLDVMMPEMDGIATLQLLRQNLALSDVPVIFMTARVQPSEIKDYLTQGANGVIAKPFNPMTLAGEITELWREFHKQRSLACEQ